MNNLLSLAQVYSFIFKSVTQLLVGICKLPTRAWYRQRWYIFFFPTIAQFTGTFISIVKLIHCAVSTTLILLDHCTVAVTRNLLTLAMNISPLRRANRPRCSLQISNVSNYEHVRHVTVDTNLNSAAGVESNGEILTWMKFNHDRGDILTVAGGSAYQTWKTDLKALEVELELEPAREDRLSWFAELLIHVGGSVICGIMHPCRREVILLDKLLRMT
jgi:hypothetical protein